uniref:Uncharacterized protein n=1 Tax=Tetranychus urticae TaxID=32264 RepID=T1KM21_TETUR
MVHFDDPNGNQKFNNLMNLEHERLGESWTHVSNFQEHSLIIVSHFLETQLSVENLINLFPPENTSVKIFTILNSQCEAFHSLVITLVTSRSFAKATENNYSEPFQILKTLL